MTREDLILATAPDIDPNGPAAKGGPWARENRPERGWIFKANQAPVSGFPCIQESWEGRAVTRTREPSCRAAVEKAVTELVSQQSLIKAARCYARAAFSFAGAGLRALTISRIRPYARDPLVRSDVR